MQMDFEMLLERNQILGTMRMEKRDHATKAVKYIYNQ